MVNVIEEVTISKTYTITLYTTVFHAIYYAGGKNEIGSLCYLNFLQRGKPIANTDVYENLLKCESLGEVAIIDGYLVAVEPYRRMVQIKGEVKRPIYNEMLEGETIKSMIDFSVGFKGEDIKNLMI